MQPARFLTLALGAVVIVGLAACSSGTTPGWTYAPPPTPAAAPSTAPGASVAASGAPAAASGAPAASVAASGGAAAPTVLNEAAFNLQFQVVTLAAPAGQPFQIAFDNKDASVQHNIQIAPTSGGANVFEGEVITGVAQTTYNVNALQAGIYKFICRIHPTTMAGELTVK